jgi:dTDP-glucose pyrophosphorylase
MSNWQKYLIRDTLTIRQTLTIINDLGENNAVLFVVDSNNRLLGTVTDGDIRRGLIADAQLEQDILSVANKRCRKVVQGDIDEQFVRKCKIDGVQTIPVVNADQQIVSVFKVNDFKTFLPLHAILMAGGKGERLLPLTKSVPKPMLKVGEKPILEHNIDQLKSYGIQNFHISINYLGHIIQEYFSNGSSKGISIEYISEIMPMGTLGSLSLVDQFAKEDLLVMNSDLLTNIDLADFYNEFRAQDADMAVATVPYHVDLPYAILELEGAKVTAFKEKPRYTYFANAGIYLFKRSLTDVIPKNSFYNATDLMEQVIRDNKKLINYPILGYWLDIGKPEDFARAQKDISHLTF